MKRLSNEHLLIIGLILAIVFCSIPFKQEVEVIKIVEHTSLDQYHVEVGFGGPKVTWVTVICNRTAEIRFMHQTGVWVSTQNVLLASFRSTTASYNFKSEHSLNIVEIVSDGPILVRIIYRYLLVTEVSCFVRVLYSF
ncbi:MAG: hypothetical protein ACW98U_11755 [Candidatus Thorarchaeota archaeon]|jgi:hypothetical protein